MKPILLLILPVLLLGTSCKKDKNTKPANQAITGKWTLVLITGGFGGIHQTATEWGHSRSFTFNEDHSYTSLFDSNTTTGNYVVSKVFVPGAATPTDIITLNTTDPYSYSFAHDTLVMSMYNISDATNDWYIRQ